MDMSKGKLEEAFLHWRMEEDADPLAWQQFGDVSIKNWTESEKPVFRGENTPPCDVRKSGDLSAASKKGIPNDLPLWKN